LGAVVSLREAERIVGNIVARMVAAGHPVEATNKRAHRPDYLPCDSYGGWKHEPCEWTGNTYFEDNLGSVLVGGWHSKAALAQLIIEMRREASATHDTSQR
jgi:hypothetical protein